MKSWIFTGRTDVVAETPILWPPDADCWLIWKGPGAGKDWGQEEKGMTEDEMVGWHHRLDGLQAPGVGGGPGGLVCCGSWGCKESDTTERLNWNQLSASDSPVTIKLSLKWPLLQCWLPEFMSMVKEIALFWWNLIKNLIWWKNVFLHL